MAQKIFSTPSEALKGLTRDNMTVAVGGFGLCGIPEHLIIALRDSGVTGLTAVSNNAGIDDGGRGLRRQAARTRRVGNGLGGGDPGLRVTRATAVPRRLRDELVAGHFGVVERRSASAAKAETDAFMAAKKRVLVFSDAGGTGPRYHAGPAAQNPPPPRPYPGAPGRRGCVRR